MEAEQPTAHSHRRLLDFYPPHQGQHYFLWCPGCHAYICKQCGSPRITTAQMWQPFTDNFTYDPKQN